MVNLAQSTKCFLLKMLVFSSILLGNKYECRHKLISAQLGKVFWVVYHLHGKPIRFEIVLIVSKISDRKSHSDYALSI
jgi:hypothetical protein